MGEEFEVARYRAAKDGYYLHIQDCKNIVATKDPNYELNQAIKAGQESKNSISKSNSGSGGGRKSSGKNSNSDSSDGSFTCQIGIMEVIFHPDAPTTQYF